LKTLSWDLLSILETTQEYGGAKLIDGFLEPKVHPGNADRTSQTDFMEPLP